MVLNPKVIITDSPTAGCGLFAAKPIAEGEEIWRAAEDESKFWHTTDEVRTWPEEHQAFFFNFAYQLDAHLWSGGRTVEENDPCNYMNHSCDPNTMFVDEGGRMIAIRPVAAGEEIRFDYASSFSENCVTLPFACACGTALCRKYLRGTDYLLPELISRYGPKGYFLPYLHRRLVAAGLLPAAAKDATPTPAACADAVAAKADSQLA